MKLSIRFDDPAHEIPKTRKEVAQFAKALRDNPGRWALYGKGTGKIGELRSEAWAIRRGGMRNDDETIYSKRLLPFGPAGSFEVQSVQVCDEGRIYVKYVGTQEGNG